MADAFQFEISNLQWLFYEPNWKAFAGLTMIVIVMLASCSYVLHDASKLMRSLAPLAQHAEQIKQLLESGEKMAEQQTGQQQVYSDAVNDIGPQLDSLGEQVKSLTETVVQMQADLKLQEATEDLQMLKKWTEDTKNMITKMGDPIEKSAERLQVFHEAFKKSHLAEAMKILAPKAESDDLEKLSKLVQGELLKMMQQFAAAETVQDSILKQGRESLACFQQEIKALSEKLVALETGMERSLNLHKTLSNEVHVAKTVMEQKIDKANKELSNHQGWCQSSFRPLFPLVPTLKYIGDSTKDGLAYHVSHNQALTHLEQLCTEVRTCIGNLSDLTESLEHRVGRVESTTMGALDAINEQSDQVMTLQRDTPQLLHQVLERLPKLPLRKPPQPEQAQQPSGSQNSQGSHDVPQPVSHGPPPAQASPTIELRLAGEHMPVPLQPQRSSGPIYMMSSPPSAQAPPRVVTVTQEELLRAFYGAQ